MAADAPEGLCPRCLLALNLAPQTELTGGESGAKGTKVVPPPPPPAPSPEEVARLFPQFELLECLGRGGMGAVYKARQPKLDRFVALKILLAGRQASAPFAERFAREARALARLNHPAIVAVHDFGEAGGYPYLVMEFVDGLSLRQLLERGKLEPEQALTIVPKICEALQFAHQQGVVHRDIKPENILLDRQGQVKIADFGIAKILAPGAQDFSLTGGKDVVGTPHYMAPEQIEQPAKVDHRADIFSLGVVFYEMLTGELPLGKFQPPSRKVHVDVRLDEVVLHALEKEPERRYQQVGEVKTAVETIAGSGVAGTPATPVGTRSASAATDTARIWAARKSWAFRLAALCFVLAALVSGGMALAGPWAGTGIALVVLNLIGAAGFGVASFRHAQFARNGAVRTRAAVPPAPPPLTTRLAQFRWGTPIGLALVLLAGLLVLALFLRDRQRSRHEPPAEVVIPPTPAESSAPPTPGETPASVTEPGSPVAPPPQPLLVRVAGLPPLTVDEIESYVQQNKRTAESLLAAYRIGTNQAYLTEAATRFPMNPDVQYAVIAARAFPEQQRQWIEAYQASSPDNALAWYFSALDQFQSGNTTQALQDLVEATGKPAFRAELAPTLQAVEELHISAGRAGDEARVLAFQACAQVPHLMPMRDLARAMQDAAEQSRQRGDDASAEALAGAGLMLGAHLSAGGGSQTLINQLVGISIERRFLALLDPNREQDPFGRSVADVRATVDQQQATLRDHAQSMAGLMIGLDDRELATYMERVKLYGEEAALAWLRARHSEP
jgi:tRNA A-37 threonylcarbamoyl transferase component Bud32